MRADGDRPGSTRSITALLVDVVKGAPGLRWMHGQGSSVIGFRDDSDVDCVLVWDQVPTDATLPLTWQPRSARHDQVVIEQAVVAGRDLDLPRVPKVLFDDWVREVDAGNGWQLDTWPSPLYSASGLAHGTVLYDPDGLAAELQDRLRVPSPGWPARSSQEPQRSRHSVGRLSHWRRTAEER